MSFPLLHTTSGGRLAATGVEIDSGYETLLHICREFPNRTVGREGEQAATQWYAEQLREVGCDDVRLDPVPCLSPNFESSALRIGDSNGEELECLPIVFSGRTPDHGITAELIYFDSFEAIDFHAEDLAGKLVLLYGWLGDYSFTDWYQALCDAGVVGIIVVRNTPHAVCYGLPTDAIACGHAPAVSISHAGGQALMRSGTTSAFLLVESDVREVTGSNVIATLPANADRIDDALFIVSTHVDAKPIQPAAADNAVGAAMAIEVMRTMSRCRRGRDIVFAGYTDEEHGFGGSRAFRRDHMDLVARCRLQLYYDGHGTAVGAYETTVTGPRELEVFATCTARDIGLHATVASRPSSLDPAVLYGDDVPSLINNREPQPTWHTRYDVPEDLAPQVMRSGVHYYAEILYRLCNEPALPFERATDDTAKNACRTRLERDVRTKLKTK
jgi:hypothetical protein